MTIILVKILKMTMLECNHYWIDEAFLDDEWNNEYLHMATEHRDLLYKENKSP